METASGLDKLVTIQVKPVRFDWFAISGLKAEAFSNPGRKPGTNSRNRPEIEPKNLLK